ncbi:hypothetical protein TNIN_412201 [Trichonephila inaurata madagascariensis]|uniref:Uncharacterized protein n=1 Tax=Trichonephila inaurata madagascariensis TaxID=2747483 RepID=A0A8X6YXM4_9ARAC|nr:hypothetical protein TNIN_412201 [Trichonephila inaurata madagascariensis]
MQIVRFFEFSISCLTLPSGRISILSAVISYPPPPQKFFRFLWKSPPSVARRADSINKCGFDPFPSKIAPNKGPNHASDGDFAQKENRDWEQISIDENFCGLT